MRATTWGVRSCLSIKTKNMRLAFAKAKLLLSDKRGEELTDWAATRFAKLLTHLDKQTLQRIATDPPSGGGCYTTEVVRVVSSLPPTSWIQLLQKKHLDVSRQHFRVIVTNDAVDESRPLPRLIKYFFTKEFKDVSAFKPTPDTENLFQTGFTEPVHQDDLTPEEKDLIRNYNRKTASLANNALVLECIELLLGLRFSNVHWKTDRLSFYQLALKAAAV